MLRRIKDFLKFLKEKRQKDAESRRNYEWYNLPRENMLKCQICCKDNKGYTRHIYKDKYRMRGFSVRCCSWCYIYEPKMVKIRFRMMWDAHRKRDDYGNPLD